MRLDPTRPEEVGGVLNPGAARGPDGELYLFPRLVAENNYSRIGIARVIFDDDGVPVDVERLGYALEPEEPYELRPRDGTGGCEDPRVTFVEPLGLCVMAYVAWGPHGPRVALAISENCLDWERLGLIAEPANDWEALRIGIGTPPVRTRLGYMVVYHGVSYARAGSLGQPNRVYYDAGVMIADTDYAGVDNDANYVFRREKGRVLRYRSTTPILIPELEEETTGVVDNVVFPTGIDKRAEDIYDIYYGMPGQIHRRCPHAAAR